MFSQYSWWDFIKFVLALAVPYYAFVIVKYYREDIREWLSNQGQPRPQLAVQTVDEDDDPVSLFTVTDYSKADVPQAVAAQQKPADWIPAPAPVAQPSARQQTQPVQEADTDVELQGPSVEAASVFSLPVQLLSENPAEQSIDAIIEAAGRLTADKQGRFSPINADDKPAAKIADIINQQQGNPMDNFAFNR